MKTRLDIITSDLELCLLASELHNAVTRIDTDPVAVKTITSVLMDWVHAGETERRKIYGKVCPTLLRG